MKLCFIIGDPVGGVRKHVHDILNAKPAGIEVLYFHSHIYDVTAGQDFKNIDASGIIRIPLKISKNPKFSDLSNIFLIWRICRNEKVDIIHGHGAKGGLYARSVGLLMRKPVVFTPHGGSVHSRFGKFKSMIFAGVEYLLKFSTTLFVFESHYTQSAFNQLAGNIPANRKLVNFNGVDLHQLSPRTDWQISNNREVHLLTVGLLSMVKGQDLAIRATAILRSRGLRVSLNLCGGGEYGSHLKSLATELKIEDFVHFQGDVADVRPFYESCDIVVIPSRFESFSYVAVEAALMKRPIVASATGGLLETVIDGETGLSFKTGSPAALADAVEQTLIDLNSTLLRITAARKRAEDLFDINKMTSKIFSIYQQLVLHSYTDIFEKK